MPAPKYHRRFLNAPTERFPSCHASTLAELPNGDLLAAFYAGSREKALDVAILMTRLTPASGRWSPPFVLQKTANQSEGNPVLWISPYGQPTLWFATMQGDGWDTCILRSRISGDGGHSWDPPRTIQPEQGWLIRNQPLILRSGVILMPMYDERDWSSFVYLSDDGGASWEAHGDLRNDTGLIQPAVVEVAPNRLLCVMRTGGDDRERTLWRSDSQDGGRTWSPPERMALPNPNAGAAMIRLRNGSLVLAFNNSREQRTPLSLALSTDDGATWPYVRDLESDEHEYSYPALIQTRDDDVQVTYTWRRTRIAHATVNESWIRGGD